MGDRVDTRKFFHELRVEQVFGKRYVFCGHCGTRSPRSIVPHLKERHLQEWSAAVQDWLDQANSGMPFRRIMREYTAQEREYILSWVVIKREVKALAERAGPSLRALPRAEPSTWRPKDDSRLDTTIWDFPTRGNWAVHSSGYEGNWSPYVPREIIRQYSRKGDVVLDPFVGSGTTLIECVLLGRRGIGVDVSRHAINWTRQRLNELKEFGRKTIDTPLAESKPDSIETRLGDARDLSFLTSNSIDLICSHPPYGAAIQYTTGEARDMSRFKKTNDFLEAMAQVAREFRRVLKEKGYCAILMGDQRRHGKLIPLGFLVFQIFVDVARLTPIEIIIKLQHHDSSTQFYHGKRGSLPYRIAHEYLFIFRKEANETN